MESNVLGWMRTALICRIGSGVVAGLAGGVVFGVMMHASGTLVTVARLVDGESVIVGWAVHLAIAAFVGITFAVFAGDVSRILVLSMVSGTIYGWLWWILAGSL
jgi:hypothetical protein